MQSSRAGSTLELVVNEQQMQNMSQVDLSNQSNHNLNANQPPSEGVFSCGDFKHWPARFRDSLSEKLDEAKAKSATKTQYVIELLRAFSGLAVWLGCFVATIIIPIVLLFIGLFNLDNCPATPSLPYYVFTIGFVMTASNLFNLALAFDLPILANHRLLASDIKNIIASILNIIFNTIVIFCYILTAFRVLSMARSGRQSNSDDVIADEEPPAQLQCDATLYNFTYWFVVLTISSFVLIGALGSALFLYNRYRLAIIRGSTPRSHANNASPNQPNLAPNVT